MDQIELNHSESNLSIDSEDVGDLFTNESYSLENPPTSFPCGHTFPSD